jgi:putative membrane protein insertion efficiency factor
MMARTLGAARSLLAAFLICGVRGYQLLIRPLLPPLCRFQPSCSEYMIEAVTKYGPMRGACKGVWRICRCGPWTAGGYDPP